MTHNPPEFPYRPIVLETPDRLVPPASWLEHIPFAFWVVDVLRPKIVVELGTHSGNSYAAFAQAIKTLGVPAAAYAVDTWKGDAQAGFYDESVYQEWAAYHNRHFSTFSRLMRSTFADALPHFADKSVDLLHIDGCHTYEAVAQDFSQWLPKMRDGGVVLFHDTNVRVGDFGVWQFFDELRARYRTFEFLHGHGLGVLAVGEPHPEPLEWLLSAAGDPAAASQAREFFGRLGRAALTEHDNRQLRRQAAEHTAYYTAEAASLHGQIAAIQTGFEQLRAAHADQQRQLEAEAVRRQEAERIAAMASADLQKTSELLERRGFIIGELHRLLGREMARRRQAASTGATPAGGERAAGAGGGAAPRARFPFPLLRRPALLRDAMIVSRSGLFDAGFYQQRYADVAASGLSPLAHYVLHGAREGRNPHPLFDGAYYLRRNADVASAGVNPLVHYHRRGTAERRSPSPLFDVPFYLDTNPDVAAAEIDPLQHFLRSGAAEGRRPNPLFDCVYYRQRYHNLGDANPLVHFAAGGWRNLRQPSADFDPAAYSARYVELRDADVNPLAHFLEYGRSAGWQPGSAPAAAAGDSGEVAAALELMPVKLRTRSLGPTPHQRPSVLCVTPFAPLSNSGGNEYRVWRLLRRLRSKGYAIVPIVAPPPGVSLDDRSIEDLVAEYGNAVVCAPDGEICYDLRDVPDVLRTLDRDYAPPYSLEMRAADNWTRAVPPSTPPSPTLCHDVLAATVLRLSSALDRSTVVIESVPLAPLCALLPGDTLTIVDVLSADLSEPAADSTQLLEANVLITMSDEQTAALGGILPGKPIVRVPLEFDVERAAGTSQSRMVVCSADDTPDNRQALAEFLTFAWPRVRLAVPDAELVVVGPIADSLDPGHLPGVQKAVADDRNAACAAARMAISPARTDTGIRREVIDALSHGRPVVTYAPGCFTPALPHLGPLCLVAGDWFDFARLVVDCLANGGRMATVTGGEADPPGGNDAIYQPLEAILSAFVNNRAATDVETI